MMKKNLTKIVIAFSLLTTLIFLPGAICRSPQVKPDPVALEIWGVWDDSDSFDEIIRDYKTAHDNVSIKYYRKTFEEYESLIVNSMAEGMGPDVLLIGNNWVGRYKNKIVPMPATLPYPKELANPMTVMSAVDLQDSFADVLSDDVSANGGAIYGLPLSVDTLALYYNKDILNNAGIPQPPRTWTALKDYVPKLRKIDSLGKITQAGISLGTARNIDRASDILSLLMLQSGASMVDYDRTKATFAQNVESGDELFSPGEDALKFYTAFANSSKETYTWNSSMIGSIDAFVQGKSAMMLGYSYHADEIERKSPHLNFAVSACPQIQGSDVDVNFANYWIFTVSRNSKNPNVAWDFIKFMTSKEEAVKYLETAKRPTARKDLVLAQVENANLKVFNSQVLTARNWYQKDNNVVEKIFLDMIDNVNRGEKTYSEAVKYAESRVTQTMR